MRHARRTCARLAASRRAGFTLVELMTVLLIITMIATAVYYTLEAVLPRSQLNNAVRELAATLQQTRSDAITRGATFKVEYYFEAEAGHPRGYRVITPFRAGGEGGFATRDEERQSLGWKALPDNVLFRRITLNGVDYDSGRIEVTFDARGSASDHSLVLVQMPYENLYTIEVQALTGLIQMHDGEFERDPPDDGDFK